MKKLLLLLLLLAGAAHAQSVQQSGSVTPNHVPVWVTNGVLGDGGTASSGLATSFGVTNNGGPGICVNSAPITGPYNALCLSASTSGAGQITLQNYGGATAQNLQLVINGTAITIPTGGGSSIPTIIAPLVINDVVCASTTNGVLKDCGVTMGPGTQWGIQYFSTAATTASTGAGTNGQVFLAQTGAAPIWSTLSGDVSSVSAAGALTLARVNGIPFPFSFTVHGVLLGEGINQFTSLTTSNVGQCLLSQGTNSDPVWGACASGSGSAGGSNTQIQYNSSTSLAGSANLTWVSPALTIGAASSATGQLALAGTTSGAVTIQPQAAAGTYNFNLPTSAGSSGQPLISGGGVGAAQTYGTLGIFGGGTNCSSASGTCLDNITGFASTGFVQRTGAGTYALSNPIPVANGGTNLANGTSGGILGFTGTTTVASSALLTLNGVVIGGGSGATPTSTAAGTNGQIFVGQTSAAPAWETAGGDIATISAAGSFTIANNAVTVGKFAQQNAYTLLGNVAGTTGNISAFAIGSLTQKASPSSSDYIMLSDQSASGALKYATVSSIASAGSVGSVNTLTGAVVLYTGPQGRLTLTSHTPVMKATAGAQTTLYYDCYNGGNQVFYYNGTADVQDTISSCQVSTAMQSSSTGVLSSANVFDVWWSSNHNICVATNGSGGGWSADTGSPSNQARGTGYSQLDTTTRPYITNANALTNCYNGATNYGSISANQATYLGTIYTSGAGQVSWTLGASASGGTAGLLGVWNYYNRVSVGTTVTDNGTSYTYGTATVRQARASAGNQIQFVLGVQEDAVQFAYMGAVIQNSGGTGEPVFGPGFDSTTTFGIQPVNGAGSALAILGASSTGIWNVGVGLHTLSANEENLSGAAPTFDGQSLNALVASIRM